MGGIRINSGKDKNNNVANYIVATSIDQLIERGIKLSASFIHIEPREKYIIIRYRVEEKLVLGSKLPVDVYDQIILTIKQLSGIDSKQNNKQQTGSLLFKNADKIIEVSVVPILGGEKIILDIRQLTAKNSSIQDLGFWGENLYYLNKAYQSEQGLIILASSDKNSSLELMRIMAQDLRNPNLIRASLGQEIEKLLPDTIKINNSTGKNDGLLGDEARLKMLIRRNPDVIFISNPGQAAVIKTAAREAAKRLLIINLIENSASGLLVKMSKSIDRHYLNNIKVIANQKKLKKLCPYCLESFSPSLIQVKNIYKTFGYISSNRINTLEKLALKEGFGTNNQELSSSSESINRLYRASKNGCIHCSYTGFIGSVNLTELIDSGRDNLNSLTIQEDLEINYIDKQLNSNNYIPFELDGLIKSLRGLVDYSDIEKILLSKRV
jgi:type IV pilus assembly protein PilB